MEKLNNKKKKTLKQRISYLRRNKNFKYFSTFLNVLCTTFVYFIIFMCGRSEELYKHYCEIFECDLSSFAYENIILGYIFVVSLFVELAFVSGKLYLVKGKKKGK